MKIFYSLLIVLIALKGYSQTQQNINTNSGTVSNWINQIDSIRFNSGTNQMEVILQSGSNESHALGDINNVTFSTIAIAPCSGQDTITDVDGNVYTLVEIGNQCWFRENLKTTKFVDGSEIPYVTDQTAWNSATTPARRYPNNNDVALGNAIGLLYNWYTVEDPRVLCPTGSHVPTDAEWTELVNYLGGDSVAGGKLKMAGTEYWQSQNTGATNSSGFNGLPGGAIRPLDGFVWTFQNGFWWTSSLNDDAEPFPIWWRAYYMSDEIFRGVNSKNWGFSVRCIKD
jgi:uncharacterized protein (TIGR02145 family)